MAAAFTLVLSLTHCGEVWLAGFCLALSHVYKLRNKLHPSDECCYYARGAGLELAFSLACYRYDWVCAVELSVVRVVFLIQKDLTGTSYEPLSQLSDDIKPLL